MFSFIGISPPFPPLSTVHEPFGLTRHPIGITNSLNWYYFQSVSFLLNFRVSCKYSEFIDFFKLRFVGLNFVRVHLYRFCIHCMNEPMDIFMDNNQIFIGSSLEPVGKN